MFSFSSFALHITSHMSWVIIGFVLFLGLKICITYCITSLDIQNVISYNITGILVYIWDFNVFLDYFAMNHILYHRSSELYQGLFRIFRFYSSAIQIVLAKLKYIFLHESFIFLLKKNTFLIFQILFVWNIFKSSQNNKKKY